MRSIRGTIVRGLWAALVAAGCTPGEEGEPTLDRDQEEIAVNQLQKEEEQAGLAGNVLEHMAVGADPSRIIYTPPPDLSRRAAQPSPDRPGGASPEGAADLPAGEAPLQSVGPREDTAGASIRGGRQGTSGGTAAQDTTGATPG